MSQQTHNTHLASTGKELLKLKHKSVRNDVLWEGERGSCVVGMGSRVHLVIR